MNVKPAWEPRDDAERGLAADETIGAREAARLMGREGVTYHHVEFWRVRHGVKGPGKRSAAYARRSQRPAQATPDTPTRESIGGERNGGARRERLRAYLRGLKDPVPVETLADELDCGPRVVRALLDELRAAGEDVREQEGRVGTTHRPLPGTLDRLLANEYGQHLTFGLCGDKHFGSIHHQRTALQLYYRALRQAGAQFALDCGDLTAGHHMFPDQEYEVYAHGGDEQEDDVVDHHPDDVPTLVIGGNHDWSHVKSGGSDVVRHICQRRRDFTFVGSAYGRVPLTEDAAAVLVHPDGGCPYARSYRAQKLIEAEQGNVHPPVLLAVGHLHYMLAFEFLRCYGFHVGCFEGRNRYLQRKALSPDVGGWLVDLILADDGRVSRLKYEWLGFPTREHDYPERPKAVDVVLPRFWRTSPANLKALD